MATNLREAGSGVSVPAFQQEREGGREGSQASGFLDWKI